MVDCKENNKFDLRVRELMNHRLSLAEFQER